MPAPSPTPPLALPAHRREVARALDQLDREAEELVRGLSPEQFQWQPRAGRSWSIGQCLDHLNVTNELYLSALEAAVAGVPRRPGAGDAPISPGPGGRLFLWNLEPPPKVRLPAPGKLIPPSARGRDEVLAAYVRLHDRARDLIGRAGDVDLNRVYFRNPFFSFLRFTVGTGLAVIVTHDRRHLLQARQVRAAAGFPG